MFCTFSALKLERSREVKFWQKENIEPMFCTFSVLKLERSREVKFWQSPNISSIVVTLDVLRFVNPSIFFSFFKLKNHILVLWGR